MEYNCNLLINWSPRDLDVEGVTAQKDHDSIIQLYDVFKNDTFIWDDISFQISMDWSQFEQIFIESEDVNGPYFRNIDGMLYKQVACLKNIIIPISVTTSIDVESHKLQSYLHRYLLDLFIVCNLAAPGLVDFYNAKLDNDEKFTPIKISNFSFRCAMEKIESRQVPYVEYVDIRTCAEWYRSLNISTRVIASNSVEKAIFSLLHILRMDDYDISTVPWIFHALEAIYGTNAGRGFSDISNKVNFLLQVEERQQKRLKRKLRELNDLRSSFIHGGYNVSHIMNQNFNDEIFEIVSFGISLVISSLQCLMKNNWKAIFVEETFVGQPAAAS
ncbi:hypothetical protein MCT03_18255 [Vibrio aestuarianus]|nr:hypothetical protein [Vibrio aestuarianus]